ncbi:MAG: MFS transporter [Pseudonocardiaceae bacterium]|nr:MFS transporter [Pseudonocardiaceae bacterium]
MASAVSNVGDGVTMAAGPLLVASITDDPALVAGAAFVQQLPWLLLSLISGAYVDRLDRRRVIVAVNLLRGGIVGGLALSVWAGTESIPLVYAAFFLLGAGEPVADSASSALLPSVVPKRELPRANARLMATFYLGNQLGAPPLGAALFVVAAALPFGFDAATFGLAAVFVGAMRRRDIQPVPTRQRRSLRAEIAEGVRWLWRHRALRMLAVCLCLMNVTFMAAFAIFVLYARRLGLAVIGYGLLLTASAIGGALGTLLASRLEARLGPAVLLRAGLIIETGTHACLAITRTPWIAATVMIIFGVHGAVWGVVAVSVRQRAVPGNLLGRVTSVYFLFSVGGAVIGSLASGALVRALGIAAPFWTSAAAMALLTTVAWRLFTDERLGTPR